MDPNPPPATTDPATSPPGEAELGKISSCFLKQLITFALALLILVLVIHLLRTFSEMLQQLLIAMFLIYLILPVRHWLEQYRLPGWLSYSIILLGFVFLLWLLTLMVQDSLADINHKMPQYEENLGKMIDEGADWIPGLDRAKFRQLVLGEGMAEQDAVDFIRTALLTVANLGGSLILVLVYAAFLLAEELTLRARIRRAFTEPRATDLLVMMHRINTSISKYILVKTFVSILTGALTTLVLWFFGVDYAIMWGVITFLLNYIPYVGTVVAMLLPSLLAVVQFSSLGLGLLIFFLLNLVQTVLGYWLEPVMAGERLNLSPLAIIVSLAFWASVWGVVGMILAVPLMVSIKIVLENIPNTRPLADLMSHVPYQKRGCASESS